MGIFDKIWKKKDSQENKIALMVTMEKGDIISYTPQPVLLNQFPNIPKEHLSVLIAIVVEFYESSKIPANGSDKNRMLFGLCENYQKGKIFIEDDGKNYSAYQKGK